MVLTESELVEAVARDRAAGRTIAFANRTRSSAVSTASSARYASARRTRGLNVNVTTATAATRKTIVSTNAAAVGKSIEALRIEGPPRAQFYLADRIFRIADISI